MVLCIPKIDDIISWICVFWNWIVQFQNNSWRPLKPVHKLLKCFVLDNLKKQAIRPLETYFKTILLGTS